MDGMVPFENITIYLVPTFESYWNINIEFVSLSPTWHPGI